MPDRAGVPDRPPVDVHRRTGTVPALWISNHSPAVSGTASGFCMIPVMTRSGWTTTAPFERESAPSRPDASRHSLVGYLADASAGEDLERPDAGRPDDQVADAEPGEARAGAGGCSLLGLQTSAGRTVTHGACAIRTF